MQWNSFHKEKPNSCRDSFYFQGFCQTIQMKKKSSKRIYNMKYLHKKKQYEDVIASKPLVVKWKMEWRDFSLLLCSFQSFIFSFSLGQCFIHFFLIQHRPFLFSCFIMIHVFSYISRFLFWLTTLDQEKSHWLLFSSLLFLLKYKKTRDTQDIFIFNKVCYMFVKSVVRTEDY